MKSENFILKNLALSQANGKTALKKLDKIHEMQEKQFKAAEKSRQVNTEKVLQKGDALLSKADDLIRQGNAHAFESKQQHEKTQEGVNDLLEVQKKVNLASVSRTHNSKYRLSECVRPMCSSFMLAVSNSKCHGL